MLLGLLIIFIVNGKQLKSFGPNKETLFCKIESTNFSLTKSFFISLLVLSSMVYPIIIMFLLLLKNVCLVESLFTKLGDKVQILVMYQLHRVSEKYWDTIHILDGWIYQYYTSTKPIIRGIKYNSAPFQKRGNFNY